jgi:hypothetical protein
VQPAAYTFIYRFMANKSAEHPQGKLDGEVLKQFFSITGEDGNFKYTPGWERIPDNWYKRNLVDEYTIPYFQIDLTNMALQHPEFLSVGGNTGKACRSTSTISQIVSTNNITRSIPLQVFHPRI